MRRFVCMPGAFLQVRPNMSKPGQVWSPAWPDPPPCVLQVALRSARRHNRGVSFATPLELRDGDRERLADLARLPSVPSGLARRARMVLLAAEGMPNAQIARLVGVSRPTVIGWRDRYAQGGIKALEDES